MASEAKPPILAAPLEIRLEIYRHTWTIPIIDAKRHFRETHQQEDNGRSNLYFLMAYFKLQVGQLHALVSICGQIRDEVLSEYFHRTQVYLWYHVNLHVPCAMQHIMSSLLFASYTQHVSLRWDIDSFYVMPSTLDWLLQLKQLKTLELLITRSYLPPIISKYHEENLFPQSMKLALDDYFGSIHFQRLTTLRNLEKIVVKLCFGPHRWCPSPEVHAGIWERTPRFQKIKETLSESVREDLRQPEQQPTYVFEQHIGAIDPEWPRSYRI